MKTIRLLNLLAVATPFVLALLAFIDRGLLLWAAFSTMLTGFLQLIAAVGFWYLNPKDNWIRIYFIGVLLFFLLWFAKPDWAVIWTMPVGLCLFFCIIIYRH